MCSKYPVKAFVSVHSQLKGFVPILDSYTFVMERQYGLRSYLQLIGRPNYAERDALL